MFINYATGEIILKIVYYGTGLCGKTTNLKYIHESTPQGAASKLLSLATQTDRTLFFDLLPVDVGTLAGMKIRLQLYTVPGQVFYNSTRQMVLKGADGVVFVVDSQRPLLPANEESLQNLKDNLREIGSSYEEVPLVMQYNKRDLADLLSIAELERALNDRAVPHFPAQAAKGVGVTETLREITRLVLKKLPFAVDDERRPEAPAAAAGGRGATAERRDEAAAGWSQELDLDAGNLLDLEESGTLALEEVPDLGFDGPEKPEAVAPAEEPLLAAPEMEFDAEGLGMELSDEDLEPDMVAAPETVEEEEEEDEEAQSAAVRDLVAAMAGSPAGATGFETIQISTADTARKMRELAAAEPAHASVEASLPGDEGSVDELAALDDLEVAGEAYEPTTVPADEVELTMESAEEPPVVEGTETEDLVLHPDAEANVETEADVEAETVGVVETDLEGEPPSEENGGVSLEDEPAALEMDELEVAVEAPVPEEPAQSELDEPAAEMSSAIELEEEIGEPAEEIPASELAPAAGAFEENLEADAGAAALEEGVATSEEPVVEEEIEMVAEEPSAPEEPAPAPAVFAATASPAPVAATPVPAPDAPTIRERATLTLSRDAVIEDVHGPTVKLPEAVDGQPPPPMPAGEVRLSYDGPLYQGSRFTLHLMASGPPDLCRGLHVGLLGDAERLGLIGPPMQRTSAPKMRAGFAIAAATEGWHRAQAVVLSEGRFLARAGCELFVFPKHHMDEAYVTYAEPPAALLDTRFPLHAHDLVVSLLCDRVGDEYRVSFLVWEKSSGTMQVPRPLNLGSSLVSLGRRAIASIATAQPDHRERNMISAGTALWAHLLPPELQEIFASESRAVDSVLIAAEDCFIPWELLRPNADALPLGARFRLGQWPGTLAPRGDVAHGAALALLDRDEPPPSLLPEEATVCHSREAALFSFTGKPLDLVAMRGVGGLDAELPAFTYVELQDGHLQAADLTALSGELKEGRPWVLLEPVLADDAEKRQDSGVAAWASALVARLHAGGLAGPRVALPRDQSRDAWEHVGQLLTGGMTIGAALREVRRAALSEPGADLAVATFALYGDPDARLA